MLSSGPDGRQYEAANTPSDMASQALSIAGSSPGMTQSLQRLSGLSLRGRRLSAPSRVLRSINDELGMQSTRCVYAFQDVDHVVG